MVLGAGANPLFRCIASARLRGGFARWAGMALLLISMSTLAQPTAWRLQIPANLPEREQALAQQLAKVFTNLSGQPVETTKLPATDLVRNLQAGRAELAIVPMALVAALDRDFAVFDSFFLFEDLAAVERYATSVDGRRLLEESLPREGLRGLGIAHAGMMQMVARRQLKASKDFNGLKILSRSNSATTLAQFRFLGTKPVRLASANTYTALRTGAVDASEASWGEMKTLFGEKTAFQVLESNHRYRGYVLLANNTAFNALPEDDQGYALAGIEDLLDHHNASVLREELEARDTMLTSHRSIQKLSRADHGDLLKQLSPLEKDQRPLFARALSVSSIELARMQYGELAPSAPIPPAPRYETQRVLTSHGIATQAPDQRPSIVYNADLSPQLVRSADAPERPVLQAGALATLSVGIGTRWPSSVLPPISPSPEILLSQFEVPLSVVMSCSFCEPHAESLKRITYRPSKGMSDIARFQFTPKARPDGQEYAEKLKLAVIDDRSGREYDSLIVPIRVNGRPGIPVAQPAALQLRHAGQDYAGDWKADVVLYAMEDMGRNVTIEIEPVSDQMMRLLGPLAFDAGGERKSFRTGIDDAHLVEAMTNSTFGVMNAVSEQGLLLKQLSASGTDVAVSPESRASLTLNDTESLNVSEAIAAAGQRLYRHLFSNSPDLDLRKMIAALEEEAGRPGVRPLRLRIVTNRLSLPWQYLHPLGSQVEGMKFWGLLFNMSVRRVSSGSIEKAAKPLSGPRKLVFARYGSGSDPTSPLAEQQVKQLQKFPIAQENLQVVDNGPELLKKVSGLRKQLAGIVTFLHASAGSDSTVPHLEFNTNDIVTSDSLENLLNKVGPEEQDTRYLAGAPLVILNACATGPAKSLPHVKLQDAMFQLGARGVLVTEVSVWVSLGHEVATRLFERLGRGEPIGDALTAVRRELYLKKHNPLGLLYVYYGAPEATLQH